MRIKNLIIAVIACISCNTLHAQDVMIDSIVIANEDSCNVESIQSAIDACLLLAESAENNDTTDLRKAKEAMQACHLANFFTLRRKNRDENESLNGHLVFNVTFADSLSKGENPYDNADNINSAESHRGQMQGGQIKTTTCFVKARGTSIYTFNPCKRTELAVVAEPGGLITTRIHAVNKQRGINEWHNDTTDVAKGRNMRKTAFTLPDTPKSKVTLEIKNCTNKDISVVVISN